MLLNKLKLGQKLAVLVLVPVIVVTYFAVTEATKSLQTRNDASRLVELAGLGTQLSALVHELQKERGMSAGFLGSKGEKFAAEIKQQRQLTDAARGTLDEFLQGFSRDNLDQEASDSLAEVLKSLGRAGEVRKRVDALTIPLGEALGYYTGINTQSLSLITRMAKLSPDASLTREIVAYASFLQSKERAGIERAVLANTFGKDQFGAGLFVKFLALKTTQENYMAMFLSMATPAQVAFYSGTMTGEAIDETERMRQVAMDKATSGGFGIDPAYWFKQQTAKINKLKTVEDSVAADLKTSALAARSQAEATLYLNLIVSMIGLGMTIALGLLVTRNVLNQLGGEPSYIAEIADQVAHGQLDTEINGDQSKRTGVFASIVSMRDTLRERLAADHRAAQENLRIRTALDGANTGVMVADAQGQIIYVNNTVVELFEKASADLRRVRPDFDPKSVTRGAVNDLLKGLADNPCLINPKGEVGNCLIEAGPRSFHVVTTPVVDQKGERLGTAIEWEDRTEALIAEAAEQERIAQERVVAAANTRLKVALDNVGSSVLVADNERQIIYANKSAFELFAAAEKDFQSTSPQFKASALVGYDLDRLVQNFQTQIKSDLDAGRRHQSELEIGDRSLRLIANAVVDENRERLGTTVEWMDRTSEVAVEKEVDALVVAASQGDLSKRIALGDKKGFFRQLGTGFNALLEELSGVFADIANVMGKLADGDLRSAIDRDYAGTFGDVKSHINQTTANLRDIVGKLSTMSDQVGSSVNEITSGNTNLSNRTEQQAANIEETASSLEELTSTVSNNADNAQQANRLASSAREVAQRGGAVVTEAIAAMDQISASSKKISEIVGVIDEIAFQTNLLALNASVEAARAGEQGRGFAVVATEVRNLASRSASAAKEIKELILDSVNKVESGSKLVSDSGQTLTEIVDSVKKVVDIVAEIAAASKEQSTGIDQINKAVAEMDSMTQQNAALAEQTASTSMAVGENAKTLTELTAYFRTH